MLMLTENAGAVINSLVDRPELPDGSGLRIASPSDGSEQLTVATAVQPEPADQVVEQLGARVFVDSTAATILDDKVLDARVSEGGKVEFTISTQ
jgi:Fe-S cluster assembly iron-binding protein IscA